MRTLRLNRPAGRAFPLDGRGARQRAWLGLALTGLLGAPLPAQAGGCETMAGLAQDVWKEFQDAALKVGCAAPSRDVALKFFTCSATKIQTGLAQSMVGWWNAAAQNRWATLGPRSMGPEWQEGQLIGTSGRTFTTLAPLYSKTTIELEKREGNARTEVTVCGFDASGRAVKVEERDIDPGERQSWKFDASSAAGHVLAVKLDAKSVANRFQYRIRTVSEPIQWDFGGPAPGFADLHVHQAAELAAAGLYYWGSHTGKSSEALHACHNVKKEDVLRTFTGQESKDLHAIPFSMEMATLGNIRHGEGEPGFTSWPHFSDIAHQQVYADWLKRAHAGGLNLIVVSAVNNEPQCRLLRLIYPQRNAERSCEDMDNVKRQIQAFIDFDRDNGWYEIAVHPWHARKIIAEGKLAVVVSVESSNLMPKAEGDFTDQLGELYAMGVRALQPVHETDSRFAGAAPQRAAFEMMQAVKWPGKTAGEIIQGRLRGFNLDDNGKNKLGMGPDGARLVDYMVDRRMLIDAAHMSERAVQDYHDYLTSKYPGYPLYNSHARFQPVLDGDDKEILKEFLVTESQIKLYQDLGGMVGVRTGWEHICDAPDHRLRLGEKWKANCGGKPGEKEPKPAVANSCPGSSRSFAQLVDFADKSDLNIAFGSDLNGNTYQVGPRYGLEQCYANRVLKKGYVDDQGPAPRAVSQEFNEHGLAHIGLLPDLLADLKALNTPGVARLERSAENFIQMWERAYDVKLAAVTNEPACKQDSDCVGGWYCSTGLTGLEPNKCKPKLEGGQACLNDRQCASGSCSPWRPQDGQASGICYTPSSVAAGGSCRIDLECKTGKCNSKKECVCKVDSDCGAGQWCDAGVDLKENVCRRKFRTGEVCGTALELNVGHRCLSGECKLHGVSKNLTCR